MDYDGFTTREMVCAARRMKPHATASEIARALKISRERARQLLVAEGLPPSFPEQLKGKRPPYANCKCKECVNLREEQHNGKRKK